MDNNQLNLFGEVSSIEIMPRRKTPLQKFREVYGYNRYKYCGDCERLVNSKCAIRGNSRIDPKEIACNKFVEVKKKRMVRQISV